VNSKQFNIAVYVALYIINILQEEEGLSIDTWGTPGVIFNNKMSWTDNINYICTKCNKRLDIIQKMRCILPRSCIEKLYKLFICSLLDYTDIKYFNVSRPTSCRRVSCLVSLIAPVAIMHALCWTCFNLSVSNFQVYPPLYLNNTAINEVTVHKHLGLVFNNKMSWTDQTHECAQRMSGLQRYLVISYSIIII
jgi:hypothetical protein